MSGSASNSGDIIDIRKLRRLAELMNAHELSEVDLWQSGTRIRLRRGGVAAGPIVSSSAPAAASTAAAAAAGQQSPAPAPAVDEKHVTAIKSPMVGTFYAASSPDNPPYVKVGDHVGPDTTVCIVEAMKVFNEIPAGISGRIIAVLAESGEPVEFGQPLFKVDTRT